MRDDQNYGGLGAVMSCNSVESNASLYLDDELGARDKGLFEKHISNCDHCQDLVDELKFVVQAAKSLNEQPIPRGVRSRLREFLIQEVGHNPRKHLQVAK